jgi:hypothetical protein
MSIVIQLFNGSPKKKKGEKLAGVILTRDPELGFRMKVQALPTKREIHRLVSDCPLAITEQTLLWLQRHKWQWKLHPNSLNVRELLKQVKTYTELLPPEHIGTACDLLLQNFSPRNQEAPAQPRQQPRQRAQENAQQQPSMGGMGTAQQMHQQMLAMQKQMFEMQQRMQQEEQENSDPLASKMKKTHQRHAQRMAHVNEVVAQNERKAAFQQEVVDNIEDIVNEVDSLVDEEQNAVIQDEVVEEVQIEIPEFFKKPQDAWSWAVELGVYESPEEAQEEYEGLKKEENPKSAKEMASLWTTTCIEIYNLVNDMDSEEEYSEEEDSE